MFIYYFLSQRDQDFDDSYDNLLRLGAIMGEVKPRGTPQEIIDGLEKKKYKEWKENAGEGEEVELRCCICLDEVSLLHRRRFCFLSRVAV